jgi:hypothetical protein
MSEGNGKAFNAVVESYCPLVSQEDILHNVSAFFVTPEGFRAYLNAAKASIGCEALPGERCQRTNYKDGTKDKDPVAYFNDPTGCPVLKAYNAGIAAAQKGGKTVVGAALDKAGVKAEKA